MSTQPRPGPAPTCDVLVVGGGPTGLFLASLLAGFGVDVQVLERRTEPSTHSRAIGLHPPAVAALERVGLADAAVAAGMPIRVGRARSRGRDLGALHFARAWPERPFVLSLPQNRTVALLEHRLGELSPGAVHHGWEVTALAQEPDGVVVTAQRAAAAAGHGDSAADRDAVELPVGSEPGPVVRCRARVVVGADGTRSRVRDLLQVPTVARPHPDTYLMGDFHDPGQPDTGEAVIHLEPGGVVESFPLPGAARRWVAHTGTTAAAASPAELARIVAGRTGVQLDVASNSMISAFTVRSRFALRMVVGRTVLVGDAAHEISPIGGQGITLGWVDALAVTPLLRDLVRREQYDPVGQMGPLRAVPGFVELERTRLRSARWAASMAQLNMALGRPVELPVAHARNAVGRLLLGSPLRHAMAWVYSMGWARTDGPCR